MLDYEWRVRDLVHGMIQFTRDERRFTETPLFERLRRVKQTDLSNSVCPSMNTRLRLLILPVTPLNLQILVCLGP